MMIRQTFFYGIHSFKKNSEKFEKTFNEFIDCSLKKLMSTYKYPFIYSLTLQKSMKSFIFNN